KTFYNTVYKKLLVLASTKLVARLPASDFPSENPRPQTRNFPYTNTLPVITKTKGHSINQPKKLMNLITSTRIDLRKFVETDWNVFYKLNSSKIILKYHYDAGKIKN